MVIILFFVSLRPRPEAGVSNAATNIEFSTDTLLILFYQKLIFS